MQYRVRYARYDKKTTESRLSDSTFVHADGFADAVTAANHTLHGMRSADPEREYRLICIEEVGSRGIECSGARLFETREELSARVAEGSRD